jgi:hypothetical protein
MSRPKHLYTQEEYVIELEATLKFDSSVMISRFEKLIIRWIVEWFGMHDMR